MSTHLQHVPEFVYRHSGWFFYLSNQLEMDRIKAETQAAAIAGARGQLSANQARSTMRRRMRMHNR